MSRQTRSYLALLLMWLIFLTGCHPTQPFYLHEDGDLSHYLDKATDIEYPDVEAASLPEVIHDQAPLTLSHPEFNEIWDLSLEECVSIALNNSKVIRGGQGFSVTSRFGQVTINPGGSTGQLLLGANARQFGTVYNPAVVESKPGQSQFEDGGISGVNQGVEAALAQFDAQLNSSVFWEQRDRPQNISVGGIGEAFFVPVVRQDTAQLRTEINKRAATGTQLFFRNVTDRDQGITRGTSQALFSSYTTAFELEARQPLLQGRGTQVNRAPIVIARIGTDIELAGLERQLHNTLLNLELRYWDLHCDYRLLETNKTARDSALRTWRIAYEKWRQGVAPLHEEAQARGQYFQFKAQVEQSLQQLYNDENALRLLMGLAATDGRLIRPIDEPTLAKVTFDWHEIQCEGLARRPELRQKKWEIKQREMELILARNRLLPQLNATALYRMLGVGDELINADRNGLEFPAVGSTAFEELTGGKYEEVRVGVDFQMPIGYRRELAGVRHAQLRLTREKAFLEDMELDLSHSLAQALRILDFNFTTVQTQGNRILASEEEVRTLQALWEGGTGTTGEGRPVLDLLLDAQRRLAQAQSDFFTRLCEYNKSIAHIHTEKGSIMEYDGVAFAEGPWPDKAYWDAHGLARKRDASHYFNYGWTRPKVVSRGPVPQHGGSVGEPVPSAAEYGETGEQIETPEPTPAKPSQQDESPPLGPITSVPEGSKLQAPVGQASALRAALLPTGTSRHVATNHDAGSAKAVAQPPSSATAAKPQSSSFDWGKFGISPANSNSATEPRSVIQPVSHEEPAPALQIKPSGQSATGQSSSGQSAGGQSSSSTSTWRHVTR